MGPGHNILKIEDMEPGCHLCSIYETEEQHRDLLTPFIRQGLERNEKLIYITDARTGETVLDYLRDDGLGVEPYLENGQLVLLTSDETYIRQSVFDPDSMIDLLRAEMNRALDEGYSALRVTGEMSWALRGLPGSERLIEYEAKLNAFFPGSKCLALCQYDKRKFNAALLLDVLLTHPAAVIGTEVFDNFYYMPPEDILGPDPEAAKLDNRLNSLLHRKRMEEALRESKADLARAQIIARIGNWEWDVHTGKVSWSDEIFRIFGLEQQEPSYELAKALTHPDDTVFWERSANEALYEGKPFSIDYRALRPDGSIVWIHNEAEIIRDMRGNPLKMFGTAQDVTERKQAEEALKDSEQRYRSLFKNNHAAMLLIDPQTASIINANPAACSYYGYSEEQITQLKITDINTLSPTQVFEQMQRAQSEQRRHFFFKHRLANGEVRDVEVFSGPITLEGRELLYSIVHDITERRQAEEALRRSRQELELRVEERTNELANANKQLRQEIEERKSVEEALRQSKEFNRSVLISLKDHIAILDREGNIVDVNDSWLQFARENDAKTLDRIGPGVNYLEVCRQSSDLRDETAKAALEGITLVLNSSRQLFELEYSCDSPTEKRWFAMSVMPLQRLEGGCVIAHTDVTRQRLAEEEARQREASLSEAQRIAHLGSWDWKIVDNQLFWSDEVYRIFGLDLQQFSATYEAFLERVHPEDREAVKDAVNRSLADPGVEYSIQHRVVRPDESVRTVHERGEVLFDSSGRPVRMIGTVQDITEQKLMEAEARRLRSELTHLERVGTIGALTGAIAHEINQPLAAILSNAQAALRLLKNESPDLVEVREALQDIVSDDKRASKVIRRLRGMLKRDEIRREMFDLNVVIAGVIQLIPSMIIQRNVVLTKDLAPGLPSGFGDPVQIQQVILNLLMNALDAVKDQTLETRCVNVSTRADGDVWVVASVRDTGPGIQTKTAETIFEPFYTTKSHGIGIGLAISRTIIEAHGGTVWAENLPEGGAQVSFRLPVNPSVS